MWTFSKAAIDSLPTQALRAFANPVKHLRVTACTRCWAAALLARARDDKLCRRLRWLRSSRFEVSSGKSQRLNLRHFDPALASLEPYICGKLSAISMTVFA